jgi:hypothetical protein
VSCKYDVVIDESYGEEVALHVAADESLVDQFQAYG